MLDLLFSAPTGREFALGSPFQPAGHYLAGACEPCGEIGAFNDDGSSIEPHRWLSADELVSLGMKPHTAKVDHAHP